LRRDDRLMPEGPEIRRAADRLRRAIEGDVARDVRLTMPAIARFERRLRGRVVESIAPRGKALLTRFEGGLTLYSHNQLYGRWIVSRGDAEPRTRRSLRVLIAGSRATIRLYSASDVAVLDEAGLARHPYLARLGPDLLDVATTPDRVAERLRHPRFAGRSLAALLLDQGFVAGIGNYLRSEMLFVAGLAPGRRPRDLDADERGRLAEAIVRIRHQRSRSRGADEARGIRLRGAALPRLRPRGAAVPRLRRAGRADRGRQPEALRLPHVPALTVRQASRASALAPMSRRKNAPSLSIDSISR
jgi:endonuclease-8